MEKKIFLENGGHRGSPTLTNLALVTHQALRCQHFGQSDSSGGICHRRWIEEVVLGKQQQERYKGWSQVLWPSPSNS